MSKVEGGGVPVGTRLNGIYEIDERVAMGGMGEVYIGHNIQTGDKVAIKMILPEHAHNQIILDLFRKEASTLNRLYHEAIVRYYVFSVDPDLDRPYLAMEYASGPSLADRLREGPLPERELDVLRRRVASGLAAAHKLGVFHRDISPDNVILLNGEVSQAKIIDFGIAKSTSAEGTLIGGGFAGKLNYVSPEQLGLAGGDVTGKSDIYSLGLVLAEVAIGKPLPMSGTQVEVLDKRRTVPDLGQVPAGIRPLIAEMLAPDPADRPEDMDAVAAWGGSLAAEQAPRAAQRRPQRGQAESEKKKGGFPWLVVGGAAMAAAAGAAFFVMKGGEPPAPPKPATEVTLSTGGATAPATPSAPATPAAPAKLSAPSVAEIAAPAAEVGTTFTWVSPPFPYTGDSKALAITMEGTLPKGLEFEQGTDGTGVVFGIPEEAGEARIRILAVSPEGETASQGAIVSVVAASKQPDLAAATGPGHAEPAGPATGGFGRDGDRPNRALGQRRHCRGRHGAGALVDRSGNVGGPGARHRAGGLERRRPRRQGDRAGDRRRGAGAPAAGAERQRTEPRRRGLGRQLDRRRQRHRLAAEPGQRRHGLLGADHLAGRHQPG